MKIKQTYYKNKIPNLWEIKKLDDRLLELVGWIKYRNACKFLMLVKMYNNRNKKYKIFPWEDKPYSFFTREQAAEYIDVSINTITNIVKYLEEKWLLKIAKKSNLNRYNHVNFYLATIPTEFDDIKELKKSISPVETVKVEEEIDIFIPEEWEFRGWYEQNEPIDFYKRIGIKWTKIEVSDVKNVFDIDKSNPVMSIMDHDDCDVYFVWGVNKNLKARCKDSDIVMKNYFWVDIDIRETIMKNMWEVISDNQLYWYIDAILERLDDSDYWDYEYVMASGNWVHIYYIWDHKQFKPENYKLAVNRIYKDIDIIIKDLNLKTDKATSNISSLFRCPLTLNYSRVRKYGLEVWPCFIYKVKESEWTTFNSLDQIAEQVLSEREQEREQRRKMIEKEAKKREKLEDWVNIFEEINKIPVHELFTRHTWLSLNRDWRNFVSSKDWKNIGCFYDENKNRLVNVWTWHLHSDESSHNTFDFVMKEILGLSNCKDAIKETIEWFKKEYWF